MNAEAPGETFAVPCELVWCNKTPLVGFAEVDGDELQRPFWYQTVKRRRLVALRTLDDPALDDAAVAPAGMIYTAGRSGSTLLSALLSVLPGVHALREPAMYRELLEQSAAGARTRWIRNLTTVYRQALGVRRLVIKWKPFVAFHHAEMSAAFPGVPAVFVYRDPVEVALSFCDFPPPMNESFRTEWFPDDIKPSTPDSLEARRQADFAVRVIAAIYDAIGNANEIRMLDYRSLPQAAWTKVAPFFGLDVDESDRRRMAELARFDPKAVPEKREFKDDSRPKQDRAGAELRALVDRLVGGRYGRLQALRPL